MYEDIKHHTYSKNEMTKFLKKTCDLKKLTVLLLLCLPTLLFAKDYNVKDYGALGNGSTLDTKAINKAIDAAKAAGGGTVFFPAGNYLSGSIHLQNNITLYIDQGAVIIAAPIADSTEYDVAEPAINEEYQDFGHSHFRNSLIWGENLHDIAIIGQGKIWGKGLVDDGEKGDKAANKCVSLLLCRSVIIRDITIMHAGWFGILATGVDNLTIDNVTMDTNRDGMDIDCCRDVRISNCNINSPNDDAIVLKSSFALGVARSTENVTITNCQLSGYDEGTVLDGTFQRKSSRYPMGKMKFGTESNGGFKNITISNCVFNYCSGLELFTVDGADLEDIAVSNITMRDIVYAPIFIRLGARMRAPQNMPIGHCRRILISNISIYNANPGAGVIITGIPGHDIEELDLNNIRIYFKGGGTRDMGKREVPEYEKDYPEPSFFKIMPSYGFFIRHVNGLSLNNVRVSYLKEDQRPAYILDQVKNADLNFVKGETAPGIASLEIKKSENIKLFQSFNVPDVIFKSILEQKIK
jgi:polygalacturonase